MTLNATLLLAGAAVFLTACANAPFIAKPGGEYAQTGNPWFDEGQAELLKRKNLKPNRRRAKNVILFIADGMDPTTVAAARIYDGQTRGEEGEENLLSFEKFPYLAMAKTYTTDFQTPDSAGTMSAMVTGVKTRSGVLSITHAAARGNCADALAHPAVTLGELAQDAGMAVGVVSTARITHATPAAVYAHSAERGWEADADMPAEAKAAGCTDIAQQLIEFSYGAGPGAGPGARPGAGLEVAFGGGRQVFLPTTMVDPEYSDKIGARTDGRDLTAEWTAKSSDHVYVWDREGFEALKPGAKALGLFEPSHLKYELQRATDAGGEPSLEELTAKAIELLAGDDEGFFLMIEAGRVDHAHHGGSALGALSEAQEFSQAIARALAMTNNDDTLIIATADHGHTLAFQGYPGKGSNILGLASIKNSNGDYEPMLAQGDQKPYTTLVYANGPGSVFNNSEKPVAPRPTLTEEVVLAPQYRQQALIPTGSETHGGQDVTIYASGPGAYLFSGVVEQNYIFHVINDALGLANRTTEN